MHQLTLHRLTFSADIQMDVNAIANTITAMPIGPLGSTESKGKNCNRRSAKNATSKVPRPPNAFIIYRKEWHSRIVEENPGLHNNQVCKSG